MWDAAAKACFLEIGWTSAVHPYQTLNVDVIASQKQGSVYVKKRASASINRWRYDGQCIQGVIPKK